MANSKENTSNQPAPAAVDLRVDLEVVALIRDNLDRLTPTQATLAQYLLHHPESLLFMSAQELADQALVSQASVVRFCRVLGFEGYTQFSGEARSTIQSQLDSAGRFHYRQDASPAPAEPGPGNWGDSAFLRILNHERDSLSRLAGAIKIDDFNGAVEKLITADRVAIIGCLSSSALAIHLGNMLAKIIPALDVITAEGVTQSAKITALTRKSVVFAIAFPRYPNMTLRLGRASAATGAEIIAITDSHVSPVSQLGGLAFHIDIGMPSFLDAYAGPITFLNALTAEVAERIPDRAARSLGQWDEQARQADLLYQHTRRGRPNKD